METISFIVEDGLIVSIDDQTILPKEFFGRPANQAVLYLRKAWLLHKTEMLGVTMEEKLRARITLRKFDPQSIDEEISRLSALNKPD